jgi:hypothetical protein
MLCCSSGRQIKPETFYIAESKEQYTVHLVCPNSTLGLELAYSKRAPFVVAPLKPPATSSEIRKGDLLIGIDNWFFNNKTSLDKVLNEVRRKMQSSEPVIKLTLERSKRPSMVLESREISSSEEKLAEMPQRQGHTATPPITATPYGSKITLESRLIDVGVQKIGETTAPLEIEHVVTSNEKEVDGENAANAPSRDGNDNSKVNGDEPKDSEVAQDK